MRTDGVQFDRYEALPDDVELFDASAGDSRPLRRSWLTASGETLIYSYLLCAPFIYYLPHLPFININIVNVIIVLLYVAAALGSLRRHGRSTPLRRVSTVFWIVLATAIASLRTSGVTDVFREVCNLLSFLSFVIVLGAPDGNVPLSVWVRRLLLPGIVQGIVAVAIFSNIISVPEAAGPRAFNGDRTGFVIDGVFGLVTQLAGFWILCAYRGRKAIFISFCAVIFGFLNVVLSGFRSYLFASVSLFLVFLIWALFTKEVRVVGIQLAIGAVLLIAALLDPSDRVSAIRERVATMLDFDTSIVWRAHELDQEKLLIAQRPWIGHGWGLSSKVKISYLGDMPAYGHDLYTGFSARIGIPLTVVLVFLWLSIGPIALIDMVRTAEVSDRVTCWYVAAIVVLTALVSVAQNIVVMSWGFPLFAIFVAQVLKRNMISLRAVDDAAETPEEN